MYNYVFLCPLSKSCLLQPCFHVAGKSRLLLRGASLRSAPPQYDNDYNDYTYRYMNMCIYITILYYINSNNNDDNDAYVYVYIYI